MWTVDSVSITADSVDATADGYYSTPPQSITRYDAFVKFMTNGTIDLDSDTFKACVVTSSYTPSKAHSQLSDVSAYRVTGTTDTALTGVTLSVDAVLDANDTVVAFPSGGTPKYVVLYSDSSINDKLMLYVTLPDSTTIAAGSNLKLVWGASGICAVNQV